MRESRPTQIAGLKPDHCAHCGYLLRGLPDTGRCPECGADYGSEDGIILFGWSQRVSAIKKAPSIGWLWVTSIWALLAGSAGIAALWYPDRAQGSGISIMLLAIAIIPISVVLCFRCNAGTRAKPNSQVRLYPDGYGQRSGFGPVRLMRWNLDIEVVVAREDEGVYRLQLERFGPAGGEDWAARVSLYFLADAAAAAKLHGIIKQWQREGSTDP